MNLRAVCSLWLPALAAAFDLASLQDLLPACSLGCLANGAMRNHCSLLDLRCQCSKIESIIKTAAPCLEQVGCAVQNMKAATQAVQNACMTMSGSDQMKPPGGGGDGGGGGSSNFPTSENENSSRAAKRQVGWWAMVLVAAVGVLP
ncbi:Extracellular membrane protein, CFEM domain protein [Metarhizium album ARSEF 1941]|uniref:Extracellular membrane protein, CFEM domain protein n=1 Tax=Metarhizium album (strain ARSEF 1941) TaxID=1081103 RepID=A0A0B2WKF4_METAS|nr:Extracellular membrane protein, CFEM domain protein [Metarhizium album ARSEF 1941]KHN96541.1 Extracellular membrane protein, CFEM domain protein [Metarhizium album ARSEF 1941]